MISVVWSVKLRFWTVVSQELENGLLHKRSSCFCFIGINDQKTYVESDEINTRFHVVNNENLLQWNQHFSYDLDLRPWKTYHPCLLGLKALQSWDLDRNCSLNTSFALGIDHNKLTISICQDWKLGKVWTGTKTIEGPDSENVVGVGLQVLNVGLQIVSCCVEHSLSAKIKLIPFRISRKCFSGLFGE